MLLIVHLLLGYRRLQNMRYCQDDLLVRCLLGVSRLPDVATVSLTLASLDDNSVTKLRRLSRQRVLEQLGYLGLARITLDFDGFVLPTGRFAEGTAVGFNRKKKGQRSYYPLLCTVAQDGSGTGCLASSRKRARFQWSKDVHSGVRTGEQVDFAALCH